MYEHKPIRIPYGKGIVGYVAESGETVNIPDAYQVQPEWLGCGYIELGIYLYVREMLHFCRGW